MTDVNAQVLFNQLIKLREDGYDLSKCKVVDCDSFAGEAIIVTPDTSNEDMELEK